MEQKQFFSGPLQVFVHLIRFTDSRIESRGWIDRQPNSWTDVIIYVIRYRILKPFCYEKFKSTLQIDYLEAYVEVIFLIVTKLASYAILTSENVELLPLTSRHIHSYPFNRYRITGSGPFIADLVSTLQVKSR